MSASIIQINKEPHLISIVRDITLIKKAQIRLQQSELRFRGAFENSDVGMALASTSGKFLQVNKRLCELWGYSEDELLDLSFQQITYSDDLQKSNDLVKNAVELEDDSIHFEKRYIKKNGDVVWAEVSSKLLRNEDKEPLYFITHIIDISERKLTEAKIKEQLDELSRWYHLTLDREGRVIELKEEVNELLQIHGEPLRYDSVLPDNPNLD
jgi:PAS domain S-box-containing protein